MGVTDSDEQGKRMRKLLALVAAVAMFGSMGAALADDEDPGTTTQDDVKLAAIQEYKARMLADFFTDRLVNDGATTEATEGDGADDTLYDEIVALRTGDELTVGWGALYKLLLIAEATGSPLSDVVAMRGDGGWGFGKIFKELRDGESEWRGDTPRNLGQFKKQQREQSGYTHGNHHGSSDD